MYDYLELMDFFAWDVERTRREIEAMRRKRYGMATLQPKSAEPKSGRLHRPGDLRGDGPELE
jgi:hypothetical protein